MMKMPFLTYLKPNQCQTCPMYYADETRKEEYNEKRREKGQSQFINSTKEFTFLVVIVCLSVFAIIPKIVTGSLRFFNEHRAWQKGGSY